MTNVISSPVSSNERINSLDLLRGFAVMGILIMNIQSFSMIGAAYINPTAYGDLTGINKWVWVISHIVADSKFMGIFSILFGAGIVLFSERISEKGLKSGGLHYRRTFWLLIFGLIHAYVLWRGDILVIYSLCAMIVYLYHKMKPRTILILGFISLFIGFLLPWMSGYSISYWPPEAVENTMSIWRPSAEAIQNELTAYRGSYTDSFNHRFESSIFMQTFLFAYEFGWRAGGMMLLGMAFYKWGILSALKTTRFYLTLAIVGVVVGTPIIIFGIMENYRIGWTMAHSLYGGAMYNYWGSIFIALAYISIIMIWSRNEICVPLKRWLSNVGRMAFTNYILQTLICVLIFHNYGLKLYGHLDRWQQILIVFAVWIVNIIFSNLWLKKFRFGPLEWIWRSLTYWKKQPMKIEE